MSGEYVLKRDIIYDHNERMLNIRKYYPYFKLSEMSFRQYKEGQFENLDMGYILMAVLRFFIEKNNFNEELVTYDEYEKFMSDIMIRDFEVKEEEKKCKELIRFIFDKINNDGRPFVYEYFNPVDKKRQSMRVKLIDAKIIDGIIYYSITSDAVEFYLDTKEVRDESNITIEQVLLGKLISSKNFKGGTRVVRRINSEVGRLLAKKNEVLAVLSHDVFQGVKVYEEFNNTVVKWFDDEQKLFSQNKELIEQALKKAESESRYYSAMQDIYMLESELNKAITRHGRLLSECTDLQIKADELIAKAKLTSLRISFDFRDYFRRLKDLDRADMIENIIVPMLNLNVPKKFDIINIDDMLLYRTEGEEKVEKIKDEQLKEYVYEDEIEDKRIEHNYGIFLGVLLDMMMKKERFTLSEVEEELRKRIGYKFEKNADWYSFLVHLCQKKEYEINALSEHPDTFLEEKIKNYCKEVQKYQGLKFYIESTTEVINRPDIASISDIIFVVGNGDTDG